MDGSTEIPIDIQRDGTLVLVKPLADIRVRGVIGVRNFFERLIADPTAMVVAIDMSHVAFIDSSGIGLLINFAKHLNAREAKVYLFGVTGELKELLDMTGIRDSIPVVDSLERIRRMSSG